LDEGEIEFSDSNDVMSFAFEEIRQRMLGPLWAE
jgi:hypothetical protein